MVWRRGMDSNPRYPFGYAGFQDRSHQPLGHLSGSASVLSQEVCEGELCGLLRLRSRKLRNRSETLVVNPANLMIGDGPRLGHFDIGVIESGDGGAAKETECALDVGAQHGDGAH